MKHALGFARARNRALRPTLIAALLCLGLRSSPAAAYSDPERFEATPEEGGGGGRFFTGSPQDGYTCAVCHTGGAAPQVAIRGLPRAGYSPGQLVEVELAFAPGPSSHALALEVLDAAGQSLELEPLPEPEITPAERCGSALDGKRATYLTRAGARRVLGVEACEARLARFRFRTTETPRILFVGTVLTSDSSATVAGDGVTEITEIVFRDGRAARAVKAGCSVLPVGQRSASPADAGSSRSLLLWLGLAAAFSLRRGAPRARADRAPQPATSPARRT